jgi:3-phenylpropionate/trans-cinnamate dioxygenase ferredoxin component
MQEFQEVADTDEVDDPGSMLIEVEDRLIVLIHAAGHWYALDDVCTHDGGPLSDGPIDVEHKTIACPRHGAQFDLASGAARTMPATKPTVAHEVKVEAGKVWLRVNAD